MKEINTSLIFGHLIAIYWHLNGYQIKTIVYIEVTLLPLCKSDFTERSYLARYYLVHFAKYKDYGFFNCLWELVKASIQW